MADSIAPLVDPVASAPGLHYRNPRLPLNVRLPDNLECGVRIYVHGTVAADADRFCLNLKDAAQDANTFLHLNPRFGEADVVVRNSRLDEAWGDEEREGGNPFAPGRPFLLAVTADVEGFQVEVDGAFFTLFKHRDGMPLCDVTHITMAGDLLVHGLHVPLPPMPIPLELRIPKKTCVGDVLTLQGEVPEGADRFAVNLQCGAGESADVMLHVNPRLGDDVLVCNSRCADAWGEEERSGALGLAAGEAFEICIAADRDAFRVFLGGSQRIAFPHRLDAAAACTVRVDGDVLLRDVALACAPMQLPHRLQLASPEDFDEKSAHAFFPVEKPCLLRVPDAFGPGRVVCVVGVVDSDPSRFQVDLRCGEGEEESVALHVNPRFDDDALVLNAFSGGEWGDEVRLPMRMRAGQRVTVHLLCEEDGFDVFVDGEAAGERFPHRLDCAAVTHVAVDGSLAVAHLFCT